MKTGRVRKKAEPTTPPTEEAGTAAPAPKPKSPPPKTPFRPTGAGGKKPNPPYLIFGILGAIFVCFVIVMIVMTLRGRADEWVEATRANGSWTTTVVVFSPQIKVDERWEADCIGDANGTVRVGTCVMKDTDTYQDKVVDDYEEYAYDIYYDETWDKTYQAWGTEFVVTALGGDDWWEENLHYTLEEELDRDSCQYTNYTLWVDDPNDTSQEAEVYLAECEVWDHVVVTERMYDQQSWCQCDVTTLGEMGQQSEQGSGTSVRWPNPSVPAGGNTERAFKGQVIFLGDDYTYTTTTDDLAQYQDYLTSQYYIGLNDGKPVTVSKNPKD
jgi:hypothetical protein